MLDSLVNASLFAGCVFAATSFYIFYTLKGKHDRTFNKFLSNTESLQVDFSLNRGGCRTLRVLELRYTGKCQLSEELIVEVVNRIQIRHAALLSRIIKEGNSYILRYDPDNIPVIPVKEILYKDEANFQSEIRKLNLEDYHLGIDPNLHVYFSHNESAKSFNVLLRFHHAITDGPCGSAFVNEFLKELDTVVSEQHSSEGFTSSYKMEYPSDVSFTPNVDQLALSGFSMLDKIKVFFQTVLMDMKTTPKLEDSLIRQRSSPMENRETKTLMVDIDEEQLEILKNNARKSGLTMFHWLTAASVAAYGSVLAESVDKEQVNVVFDYVVNMRSPNGPNIKLPTHHLVPFVSSSPAFLTVPHPKQQHVKSQQDWLSTIGNTFKQTYEKSLQLHLLHAAFVVPYFFMKLVMHTTNKPVPVKRHFMLVSDGVLPIKRVYQHFQLINYNLAAVTVQMPVPFIWKFYTLQREGELPAFMKIVLSWVEPFNSRDDAQKLMNTFLHFINNKKEY